MILGILVVLSLMFGLGAIAGAPYVPVLRRDQMALLSLVELQPGQTIIDLGSGDGRLLREAAARGMTAIGYEINPLLYAISLIVCWPYRHSVTIHLGDYWHRRLPQTDVMYVFLIERYMKRLDTKLVREITKPTTVISHIFKIPGRAPIAQNSASFVYRYPVA